MDQAERASLVEAHRALTFKAVRLVWPRVQGHVEKRDLVSMADLGLVEAAARFDPDAGVKFATFAWYRVQGAIIDGLRKNATLPRRVWAQLCALRAAGEFLEAEARKDAAARAAGAGPGDTEQKLRDVREAMAAIQVVYSVAARASIDDVAASMPDPAPAPDRGLDHAAFRRRLDAALARLPEKERALVEKHYFDGKNLMEAGAELGISKSWASRLHAQAVGRLRTALGDLDVDTS